MNIERARPDIAFILPAHNEEPTISDVITACEQTRRELGVSSEVVVVADACEDSTAERARNGGALVIELKGPPSKARALAAGVEATDSDYLFFVDADCIGLRSTHLSAIARPVLGRVAAMSVGVFDYGRASTLVQRFPWSTGQRILSRDIFPTDDSRLRGYNVELLINEAIGKQEGLTTSFVMAGVRQRTKAQKHGILPGTLRNLRMWKQISSSAEGLDLDSYKRYMQMVHLGSPSSSERQAHRTTMMGYSFLRLGSAILGQTIVCSSRTRASQ